MRLIPIDSVKEGTYLANTIFDSTGKILLLEGIQLTKSLIQKIKGIGVFSLYINDEYSDSIIEDVIKPELRQKAIQTIKNTFFSFEKYNLFTPNMKSTGSQLLYLKEKQSYFHSIQDISKEIVEQILDKKNVIINLTDIKSLDNFTYQHSVNVAVLSLILGIQLNLDKEELYDLCMGALVFDIGKMLIPQQIIEKTTPLTQEELSFIKEHSYRGYEFLKGCKDISAAARAIALQHHERINGSGYPDGRKSYDIHKLARITAIADVYDALTSDRPYRKALSPNDALEYIMAFGGTLFDYQMVQAFSKAVLPYPEGTLVQLSNEDIAVVKATYPNYPLRPSVKIIKSKDISRINTIIDLTVKLDIVIKKIQYEVPE